VWPHFFLAALVLFMVACNDSGSGKAGDKDLFGNRTKDLTDVICRVNGIEITQRDMDLRFAELPTNVKGRFSGEGWQKRFIRFMADEAILAREAELKNLESDPLVAQQIISLRRGTLIDAYKQYEIFAGAELPEAEIQEYYNLNMDQYVVAGAVRARHIQCPTKAEAEAAYAALTGGGKDSLFPTVLAKYSRNIMTAKEGGDLGWFNDGGFIRYVTYGKELASHVFGWEIGLHPPEFIGTDWHVIEILDRKRQRQLALSEVRDRIKADSMPSLQNNLLAERLNVLRGVAKPEFYGVYAPGSGRSVEELFQHGVLANSPEKQLELFELVLHDFPESEFVPKALFMMANIYLDNWGDTRRARTYLSQVIRDHPDSDLREQSDYIMNNMGKIDFRAPKSIQELQNLSR